MRPVYLMVVAWGEEFRRYILDYLVPSLLSPGNIPALEGGGHKFLFIVPDEDWLAIKRAPIVRRLAQYAEPTHIAIPHPQRGVPPCIHMGIGHKLATEYCYEAKSHAVFLAPDSVISNGTLRAAQQHALRGKSLVVAPVLRHAQEPLFDALQANGYDTPGVARGESGLPLTLSGRDLVRFGVAAFHSQSQTYDFDAPCFFNAGYPNPAVFWRVPSDGGVVLHCMSWSPVLMDYSAVKRHDTRALETWTIDGDYLHANFANAEMHACTDSDEMMIVSWAPLADRPFSLLPTLGRGLLPAWRRRYNTMALRRNLTFDEFDPMKRALFTQPVRWHVKDLDNDWLQTERQAASVIASSRARVDPWFSILERPLTSWRKNRLRLALIRRAVRGDDYARAVIRDRLARLAPLRPT